MLRYAKLQPDGSKKKGEKLISYAHERGAFDRKKGGKRKAFSIFYTSRTFFSFFISLRYMKSLYEVSGGKNLKKNTVKRRISLAMQLFVSVGDIRFER
uniref:Uncharacterized protein n=1 Tax=Anopheles minimus TaxID=112268 RepID=A0A182WQE7_9DIPT